jgi:FkbM family methyltransferase
MTFTRKEGWLWPAEDTIAWPVLCAEAQRMPDILGMVPNKGVALQAGGHCGLMVRPLADAFKTVYTFEPHPVNFVCLVNNVPDPHVIKMQACLGDSGHNPIGLTGWGANTAYVHIDREAEGTVPMLTIDDLNLPALDLLMLDIEGFEYAALVGGMETIRKRKPVIVLELIGHGKRYGFADNDVVKMLRGWGYSPVARLERDTIFICERGAHDSERMGKIGSAGSDRGDSGGVHLVEKAG